MDKVICVSDMFDEHGEEYESREAFLDMCEDCFGFRPVVLSSGVARCHLDDYGGTVVEGEEEFCDELWAQEQGMIEILEEVF